MAQVPKIVDLTQSYVPVDPNTFPDGQDNVEMEQGGRRLDKEILAFEGQNFMPTGYGYKSYFGTASELGIDALTSRVDDCFIVQTRAFNNIIVALCEDGIWTKEGTEAGAWTHTIVLTIPPEGQHNNWSWCVMSNAVYMYRAGEPSYYFMGAEDVPYEVDSFPSAIVPIITPEASPSGFPIGNVIVQIAYIRADGGVSAPSAEVVTTLTTPSWLGIAWTGVVGAAGYYVYRTIAGVTHRYYKAATGTTSVHVLQDMGGTDGNVPTLVTLPDMTWLPLSQVAAYTIREATPAFLNMEGQIGIFKAGGSLGFWDSEDSISWSSLDDFTDFEPSLTTLAGSAVFSDVTGRIVNILSLEEDFVIYATTSVTLVQQAPTATFQWEPNVLLAGSGIAFPKEACASYPDKTHYAYTNTGLYKIQKAKAEVIVPEITDFLRESEDPIDLKVIEGRYLCLQIIDPLYLSGMIHTSIDSIPAAPYVFPPILSVDDLVTSPSEPYTPKQVCYTSNAFSSASTEEQQAAAAASQAGSGKPPKKAGTSYRARFQANFSIAGAVDPADIVWGTTPCPTVGPTGTNHALCPTNGGGKLADISPDIGTKISLTGTHWNIDTFVATQLAIWKWGDKRRDAFLAAIINKAVEDTGPHTVLESIGTLWRLDRPDYVNYRCPVPGAAATPQYCDIGTYINAFSNPHFGMNQCSFWLTRYAIGTQKIRRNMLTTPVCSQTQNWLGYLNADNSQYYPTTNAIVEWARVNKPHPLWTDFFYKENGPPINETSYATGHVWVKPKVGEPAYPSDGTAYVTVFSTWKRTKDTYTTMVAHNEAYDPQTGVLGVDRGWLEQIGWEYTDVNNVVQTLTAGTCALPASPPTPPSPSSSTVVDALAGLPVDPLTGTMCGTVYTPVLIPAISPTPIEWEVPEVVIPGGSFLLQEGSIGPIYPTYKGIFVYDTQLKKWGKMVQDYKILLDYSPINEVSGAIIPFETFGINGGCLKESGKISIFDQLPENSYIKYGKIGYYRLGMTQLEEVRVDFRNACTGLLRTNTSLDGRSEESSLGQLQTYTGALQSVLLSSVSGRWHSITIEGQYDITGIEYRGHKAGRR